MSSTRLFVVPLELAEANRLVAQWHRHHQPSQGHRFSLGVMDNDGVLHGAANRRLLPRLRLRPGGVPACSPPSRRAVGGAS